MVDKMTHNPLSDYLDELLTPAPAPEADWDSMLADAVEPFQQPQSWVFSTTTLESGKTLVVALEPTMLSRAQRCTQLHINLKLASRLPSSKLRDYVLHDCDLSLKTLYGAEVTLQPSVPAKIHKAIQYD